MKGVAILRFLELENDTKLNDPQMIPPEQQTDIKEKSKPECFYTVPQTPLTVSQLIATASSNDATLLVPDLQRPFVWEPTKIMLAIDSLLRGWPLGSFVFWRFNPKQEEGLPIGMNGFYRHAVPGDDPSEKRERFKQSDFQNPKEVGRLVLDGQQRIQSLILAFSKDADGLSWRDNLWLRKFCKKNCYGKKHNKDNVTCGPAQICINLNVLAEQWKQNESDGITFFSPDGERDQQPLVWVLREKCNSAYTTFPMKSKKEWPENVVLIPLHKLWTKASEGTNPQKLLEEDLGISAVDKIDELKESLEFFLERLATIREQSVSSIEIRPISVEDNLEYYNSAIIDVFTRLNTAGEALTREQIVFSWVKRGWTIEPSTTSAETCFASLRESLKHSNIELTSDQLVRAISVIWAVLKNQGRILRQEDYLGGKVTNEVARYMCKNWQEISQSLISVAECFKGHNVTFGDHILSTLPLSLLASFRMSIYSPGLSPLIQSTSLSTFDALMNSQFLRFTFCAQISHCFEKQGLMEKWAKDLMSLAGTQSSEICNVFKEWVVEITRQCNIDIKPARNRREVARYRQFLRVWHQISDKRMRASLPFHVDHISGRQERLEVDHVVSVALFEKLVAVWPSSSPIDTNAIVNRLGNCLLLTKGHNISKSEGCIFDHFKNVTKDGNSEDCRVFLEALQIPTELANPRESLLGFEIGDRVKRLQEAIERREQQMKESFIKFAKGEETP
jgi:hypothetical protein